MTNLRTPGNRLINPSPTRTNTSFVLPQQLVLHSFIAYSEVPSPQVPAFHRDYYCVNTAVCVWIFYNKFALKSFFVFLKIWNERPASVTCLSTLISWNCWKPTVQMGCYTWSLSCKCHLLKLFFSFNIILRFYISLNSAGQVMLYWFVAKVYLYPYLSHTISLKTPRAWDVSFWLWLDK